MYIYSYSYSDILHFTFYILHFTLYILHFTFYIYIHSYKIHLHTQIQIQIHIPLPLHVRVRVCVFVFVFVCCVVPCHVVCRASLLAILCLSFVTSRQLLIVFLCVVLCCLCCCVLLLLRLRAFVDYWSVCVCCIHRPCAFLLAGCLRDQIFFLLISLFLFALPLSHASVCRFKTHVGVVPVHTGTFLNVHGDVFNLHTGFFQFVTPHTTSHTHHNTRHNTQHTTTH